MRFIGLLIAATLFLVVPSVQATVIADSLSEFSGTQGTDNWFYGYYNQGFVGGLPHGYDVSLFVEFDTISGGVWEASDAQVGAQNNDFLRINDNGGHPTGIGPGGQDSVIWAIRRYVSEVTGVVDIGLDLRKLNVTNPRGGGITGRIFVDGVEEFTQFIANDDGFGVQSVISVSVSIGSFIDFAIDPTGVIPPGGDGMFAARADGSLFRARVCSPTGSNLCLLTEVSAPPTPWLLLTIVVVLTCQRRKHRDAAASQSSY